LEAAVSLQGTLDTFALPDVLRLLAGTHKTGHLIISGSRGSGDLWLDSGHVVAAETSNGRPHAAPTVVLFELLRYVDGSFTFHNDMTTSDAGSPADIEPLLLEAEILLEEWQTIEAVVPSTAAFVFLRPELLHQTVSISADQWRTLVAVGGGTTVADIGDTFELGELDVCRTVKNLVEAGLLEVGEAIDDDESEVPAEAEAEPAAPARQADSDDGLTKLVAMAADAPMSEALARQLAQLGPDAARAVAVAASAETREERDAALDGIEGEVDGEPINRGLLLKFLSSVKS
jgi:hypothetical protein